MTPSRVEVMTGGYSSATLTITNATGEFSLLASLPGPIRVGVNFQPASGVSAANETFTSQMILTAAVDADLGEFEATIGARYLDFDLICSLVVVVRTSTDLVPNDFRGSLDSPNVDQTISLSASVANLGYGNPGTVGAMLLWNGGFLGNVSNSIGPMQSVTFALPWTPKSEDMGENVFTIAVDPDHRIDEINKANNNATTRVCVACGTYSFRIETIRLRDVVSKVILDGTEIGLVSDARPWEDNFPLSEFHTIAVEEYVQVSQTIRLHAGSYTWDTPQTSGMKTVVYSRQYLGTITVSPSKVTELEPFYVRPPGCSSEEVSCWYDDKALFQVSWKVDHAFANATRWILREVNLDGRVVPIQTYSPWYMLFMDQRHVLEIRYVRQYLVNVTSEYSIVEGNGWVDSGEMASWRVKDGVVAKRLSEPFNKFLAIAVWRAVNGSDSARVGGPIAGKVQWVIDWAQTILQNSILFAFVVAALLMDKAKKHVWEWLNKKISLSMRSVRALLIVGAVLCVVLVYSVIAWVLG